MITQFYLPEDHESKDLYFALRNSFALSSEHLSSETGKFAGVYAIFKKGVCYYVGQSKNLASRLSTHLTGKYIEADEVRLFMPSDNCLTDFYLDAENMEYFLLTNEAACIDIFKPIENILVKWGQEIPTKHLFWSVRYCDESDTDINPSFRIFINSHGFTVVEDSLHEAMMCIDERATDDFIGYEIILNDHLNEKFATG